MLALIIIGCVLLFLFLLTVIPLRVELGFRQEFTLTVRYLFLHFPLLPGKGEETEQEGADEVEKESESAWAKIKKILKRQGLSGFLKSLFELIKIAASSSKRLLSHVRLKYFDLYLCLAGGEDAGEAALRYGQLSGALYSACGLLFSLMDCRKKSVSVDLDYQSLENRVDFSAKASVLPLFVLKEGISLLIKGLPAVKRLMGTGGPKNEKERVSQTRKQGEGQ